MHPRAPVSRQQLRFLRRQVRFSADKPRRQWKRAETQDELVDEMQAVLGDLPGTRALFTQPIEMRMNEMIAGIRADVGVTIFGDDFDQLETLSEQVAGVLRGIPGATDVSPDQVTGQPSLRIEVDPRAIAHHGVSRRQILETIRAIGTLRVGEIRQGRMRFPLAVRLSETYRQDPEAVGGILISTAGGKRLPLRQLASIKRIARLVESWPEDYNVTWGGQFEHVQRAGRRLMIVVPLALILIFTLLCTTFNSIRDAVVIFCGVPFAVVGGIMALYVRGMPFSISAGVGFIALFGIAVLNGLVLVSHIRQLVAQGTDCQTAIRRAGLVRLRPVLMTAVTDALGFVPMMLSAAVGAEVQRPLATVVVGGVISSMLLTLLVLPALYSVFYGAGIRRPSPADW